MHEAASVIAQHWALGVFVVAVFALCAFMIGAASLLGGRSQGPAKNSPFESGVVGTGDSHIRLSAKFYLVAILFVIFDVEALFLYAWAVSVRESGWTGFAEATVFIAILLVGLVYLWRVGALNWAPQSRRAKQAKLER